MEFNWWVGHLFGGLRNKFVLNVHSLKIWVVHQLVYIYNVYIFAIFKTDHAKFIYPWYPVEKSVNLGAHLEGPSLLNN